VPRARVYIHYYIHTQTHSAHKPLASRSSLHEHTHTYAPSNTLLGLFPATPLRPATLLGLLFVRVFFFLGSRAPRNLSMILLKRESLALHHIQGDRAVEGAAEGVSKLSAQDS